MLRANFWTDEMVALVLPFTINNRLVSTYNKLELFIVAICRGSVMSGRSLSKNYNINNMSLLGSTGSPISKIILRPWGRRKSKIDIPNNNNLWTKAVPDLPTKNLSYYGGQSFSVTVTQPSQNNSKYVLVLTQ